MRVLLADLLQQRERLGIDPGFMRGDEPVELRNAIWIGADRRQPRMLIPRTTANIWAPGR